MASTPDVWEARAVTGDTTLDLRGGDEPALVLVQGDNRVRVELGSVKALVAALTDAVASQAGVLARDS
jgi:hypothetical protein